VPSAFDQQVRQRAQERCEYCHVPTAFYVTPSQLDHVIAKQHGGATALSNLALACYHCNLHKGPNIASLDPPATGQLVRLFNPRLDAWHDHFQWQAGLLIGRTPIGRATILVLSMNDAAVVAVRESLILEGIDLA
jgi:hypothetical protein